MYSYGMQEASTKAAIQQIRVKSKTSTRQLGRPQADPGGRCLDLRPRGFTLQQSLVSYHSFVTLPPPAVRKVRTAASQCPPEAGKATFGL